MSVSTIQKINGIVIDANKTEMLIAITISDAIVHTVLMEPSSTGAGYPILSRLIIVRSDEADTTLTVINLTGGVWC